jgi:hypothetical protein
MSAPSPAYLCKFNATQALAAGVPVTVDVPINGARHWMIVVSNTGANAVTALTVASSPLGSLFEDATAVTSSIPLAAGSALSIRGTDEPVTTHRLVLTSTSGTTVSIEAGGW